MKRETFHGAVWILDSFLCRSTAVSKGKFQLVALSALMISAKIEEIDVPSIADYIKGVDFGYNDREIRRMEQSLLSTLQWKVAPSTLSSWVNWTLAQWDDYALCVLSPVVPATPLFKAPSRAGYEGFRYCAQLADSVLFKLPHYRYQRHHLAAAILYLGIANALARMTDSLELGSLGVGRGMDGVGVMLGYEWFVREVLGVGDHEVLWEVVEFVWDEGRVQREMEMPKVCEVMEEKELEKHFEDFVTFQTYANFSPV